MPDVVVPVAVVGRDDAGEVPNSEGGVLLAPKRCVVQPDRDVRILVREPKVGTESVDKLLDGWARQPVVLVRARGRLDAEVPDEVRATGLVDAIEALAGLGSVVRRDHAERLVEL